MLKHLLACSQKPLRRFFSNLGDFGHDFIYIQVIICTECAVRSNVQDEINVLRQTSIPIACAKFPFVCCVVEFDIRIDQVPDAELDEYYKLLGLGHREAYASQKEIKAACKLMMTRSDFHLCLRLNFVLIGCSCLKSYRCQV